MDNLRPPVRKGWYSARMARIAGTLIYRSADGTREIEITCTSSGYARPTKWDDIVFVGEVGELLRIGEVGEITVREGETLGAYAERLSKIVAREVAHKTGKHRWN